MTVQVAQVAQVWDGRLPSGLCHYCLSKLHASLQPTRGQVQRILAHGTCVFQSQADGPGISGGACPSLQAAMKLASRSLGVRGPEVPGNSEHGQSMECIRRPKAEWHGSIGEALRIWFLLSPISSLPCPPPEERS